MFLGESYWLLHSQGVLLISLTHKLRPAKKWSKILRTNILGNHSTLSPVVSEKKAVDMFYSSPNKYLKRLVMYHLRKYLAASPTSLVHLWFGKALNYSRFQGVSGKLQKNGCIKSYFWTIRKTHAKWHTVKSICLLSHVTRCFSGFLHFGCKHICHASVITISHFRVRRFNILKQTCTYSLLLKEK